MFVVEVVNTYAFVVADADVATISVYAVVPTAFNDSLVVIVNVNTDVVIVVFVEAVVATANCGW